MRDINFFSIYSQKSTSRQMLLVKLGILALGFAAIIGAVYLVFFLRLVSIRDKTDEISKFLSSSKVSAVQNTYKIYDENSLILDGYDETLRMLNSSLYDDSLFTTELIATISGAIPAEAKLTSVSYTNGALSMTFNAPGVDVAAQLDSQFSAIDEFLFVFTRSVEETVSGDGSYDIAMEALLDTAMPEQTGEAEQSANAD